MMRRGGVWYVKRRFAGLGLVKKSLGTTSRERARQLEAMLLALDRQGRSDLLRAFARGELRIARFAEAYESGRLPELAARILEPEAPLSEASEACLRNRRPDIASSTLERYRDSLAHFRRFCESKRIATVRAALTTEAVREFKDARLREGAAPHTLNNDLNAVSTLAGFCMERGWLSAKPEIRRFRSTVRIRYLEPDQLTVYMASVRGAFRPLFQLLVGTGMRIGEAQNLRVCDLRFGRDGARALVERSGTKSRAGVRRVFLPAWVAEALREHIERSGASGTDPVFTWPRGTIRKEHYRACRIAGIAKYTMHDHRHTAAVHLSRVGMPLHLVQKQLGHATIAMTMKYAEFNPEYGDVTTYFERVAGAFGVRSVPKMGPTGAGGSAREEG